MAGLLNFNYLKIFHFHFFDFFAFSFFVIFLLLYVFLIFLKYGITNKRHIRPTLFEDRLEG